MRDFLIHYGHWAAFALALIENDVAFIAIGVAARLGGVDPTAPENFNVYAAALAAIVGALMHDSAWFTIGHRYSAWFKSSRVYQRIGPSIERFAQRFGPWEIFFARFIYGTRNPTSIFWGIHRLRYTTFAGIELLALTVWGTLLIFVGFHFTSLALMIIGKVERHHHPQLLLLAIAIAFVTIYALRVYNRRRIYRRRLAREAAAAAEDTTAQL